MKSFVKKVIPALVICLMVLPVLAGCGGKNEGSEAGAKSSGGDRAAKSEAPKANPATDFEYDFEADGQTLYIKAYKGTSTMLVFPAEIEGMKVTRIGRRNSTSDSIFRANGTSAETVVIPEGVTKISVCAFAGMKSLKSVQLPSTLEEIGSGAFEFTGIEKIEIPKLVKKLSSEAFDRCPKLVSVVLPDTLEFIDENAFYSCKALTDINIPAGIKEIDNMAFFNAPLTNMTVPESLQAIKFPHEYIGPEHFKGSQPPLLVRKRLQELGYKGNF